VIDVVVNHGHLEILDMAFRGFNCSARRHVTVAAAANHIPSAKQEPRRHHTNVASHYGFVRF
jgi:hypothetical protein